VARGKTGRRAKLDATPTPAEAGVDGGVLSWALFFIVERAWMHLGTESLRHLLLGTHAELLPKHPSLGYFEVCGDGRVHVDASAAGGRLPQEAVDAVAAWALTFRNAVQRVAPDIGTLEIREVTRLMGGVFEKVGFYAACDAIERGSPRA
jgi:hypothetical protein